MHFHCEMAVAQHEVVTKSATHVTLIRGQPCSVAVALKEIGDPRSLWDQTTAMLCNSGSSVICMTIWSIAEKAI